MHELKWRGHHRGRRTRILLALFAIHTNTDGFALWLKLKVELFKKKLEAAARES